MCNKLKSSIRRQEPKEDGKNTKLNNEIQNDLGWSSAFANNIFMVALCKQQGTEKNCMATRCGSLNDAFNVKKGLLDGCKKKVEKKEERGGDLAALLFLRNSLRTSSKIINAFLVDQLH